jgi:hypothetical protein
MTSQSQRQSCTVWAILNVCYAANPKNKIPIKLRIIFIIRCFFYRLPVTFPPRHPYPSKDARGRVFDFSPESDVPFQRSPSLRRPSSLYFSWIFFPKHEIKVQTEPEKKFFYCQQQPEA